MRISSQQVFQSSVQRMQETSIQQARTQEQLSTGHRVNRPSDDPVAAARILQLGQELARTEQFERNIDFAENRLAQEDSTLASVNDLLIRVRELAVKAGNGTLTAEDRSYIAAELEQRLEQLGGLANSQDSNGQYVFGGYDGANAPFEQNAEGRWVYTGDDNQRSLEVDTGMKVPIGDNGKRIFTEIPSPMHFSAVSGGASVTGEVTDLAAFQAAGGTEPVNLEIQIDNTDPLNPVYTVTDLNSGNDIGVGTFDPDTPTEINGVRFETTGDLDTSHTFNAAPVTTLGVVEDLVAALHNYTPDADGEAELSTLLASTLVNLDDAQSRILEVRAEVGARLNTIESTREFHADSGFLTKSVMSDLRDLDYAEAISRFSQQSMVLDAAQMSFSRISQMSLFDRL